jgi:hypothetical protein
MHGTMNVRATISFVIAINKYIMYLYQTVLSLRPSFRMEQFGSYWTNFHEIKYFSIVRKYVEKIQGFN